MSDNTSLLWAFCAAARHDETCETWEQHRSLLDMAAGFIHGLIASIPDEIARGKTSQAAAKSGQQDISGKTLPQPTERYDYRDVNLPAKELDWHESKTDRGRYY